MEIVQQRPEEWLGRKLGKYEISEVLGVGGMGMVLKAHDTSIERNVAIKVLPSDVASDAKLLQRFLAEAKSAGKLNHPHTVTIHGHPVLDKSNPMAISISSGLARNRDPGRYEYGDCLAFCTVGYCRHPIDGGERREHGSHSNGSV